MTAYDPQPIDTSRIRLTASQEHLIEALAANVHAVWAKKRIEDGWRYGPARNDDLKTHPGLVTFEELSEEEKDYDRIMVEQVVKAAVALGYRIEREDS